MNFYQPDPGPDWTKKLKEIYARQTQQREEHHRNLLQQSAELERADPGVANLAMFKQILETTKAGVDVYNAFHSDTAKAKRFEKNKKAWDNMSIEEQNSYRLRWKLDKAEIYKEDEAFFKKIKNDFKLKNTESAKELLKNAQELSGRRILRFQEASAAEQVQLFTNAAHTEFLQGNPDAKKAWDLAASDPILQAKQQREWKQDELDKLAYTKEVQSTVLDELNRQTKTKETTGNNLFKTEKEALELRQLYTQINAQSVVAKPDDSAAFIHELINERKDLFWDIEDGPTATQQAVESVVSDLYQMGATGKLTRDTYNKMLTGKIDGHPAGDTLKVFLDKNGIQESHILEGIEEYENADYATRASLVETDYKQTFVAAADGKLSQEDYKAKVEFFNRMPLKEAKTKLDRLEKVFNTNQGEEKTKADIATWQSKIDLGILEQDDIDSVSNMKANRILQAKFNLQEKAKDLGKVDSVHTGIAGKVQQGKKGPFGTGKASIETQQVTDDITDFYNKEFFARAHAAGPDADFKLISDQALSATKDYMEVNGFGKKPRDPEAGKFSADGLDGDYTLYSNSYAETKISDGYLNAGVEYSSTTAKLWDSNIQKTNNKSGYGKPKDRFNKPDGLYTNGMLGHFLETGEVSDQMLYIAKKNGLNISRAIGYSINAKLNSSADADKDFAKNFNIKQINTKAWPDQTILDKGYDRVTVLQNGGKDAKDPLQLLAQAKNQGFDSLSTKQMQRLLVHIEGEKLTGGEAIRYKLRQSGKSHEEINQIFEDEIRNRKEQLIENTKYSKNYG